MLGESITHGDTLALAQCISLRVISLDLPRLGVQTQVHSASSCSAQKPHEPLTFLQEHPGITNRLYPNHRKAPPVSSDMGAAIQLGSRFARPTQPELDELVRMERDVFLLGNEVAVLQELLREAKNEVTGTYRHRHSRSTRPLRKTPRKLGIDKMHDAGRNRHRNKPLPRNLSHEPFSVYLNLSEGV